MNRRNILQAASGGIIGTILGGGSANAAGFFSSLWGSSDSATGASAEQIDGATPHFNQLGDYLWLTPTKLGGGAQVQDLSTGKTLAWIEYWNYGDSCPIAHHLAAFPSSDPRKGFEFVNSTQGGQNVLIYGIPTQIREHGMLDPIWGQGNQIYRVGFDGQQMNLLENIAETTGIGVGVHTVIFPDASGFSCSDGQKDIVAFFTRATGQLKTKVIAAFRFDWYGNETDGALEDNWFKGGKVRITKLVVAPETGLYDYRGTKGNKLDWEMVPMGEYLVYTGQLPGDAVRRLTGSDNCVHHPIHPLSLVTLRMFAVGVVIDRTSMEPIACISSPAGTPKDNIPVTKVSDGTWEIKLDTVTTSGHECGFGPNGKWFVMTNNTRQNSMGVFNCADPDPRKWTRITDFKDPHRSDPRQARSTSPTRWTAQKCLSPSCTRNRRKAPSLSSIPLTGRRSSASRTSVSTAKRCTLRMTESTSCKSLAASKGWKVAHSYSRRIPWSPSAICRTSAVTMTA